MFLHRRYFQFVHTNIQWTLARAIIKLGPVLPWTFEGLLRCSRALLLCTSASTGPLSNVWSLTVTGTLWLPQRQTFKGLIWTLPGSLPHWPHVSGKISRLQKNPQQSQPSASVHPPHSLHPVSRHVSSSLIAWRAFILLKGMIDFQPQIWIHYSEPWNC